ncbi:hypothetical protein A19Y_4481 [Planktothrix agardhii NIVA-CYA 126/8]|uniref:Uncharacterized protein n=1 Tax=Planktothrix agardhii (strain NIVA-CYA 126/8) TaxID=388467 RepID=A0A073CLU9_PLAA1|nr:hypothetical protein A19Y_4481 [Planktothrix agardhii NIVA-CYA 126/8]
MLYYGNNKQPLRLSLKFGKLLKYSKNTGLSAKLMISVLNLYTWVSWRKIRGDMVFQKAQNKYLNQFL